MHFSYISWLHFIYLFFYLSQVSKYKKKKTIFKKLMLFKYAYFTERKLNINISEEKKLKIFYLHPHTLLLDKYNEVLHLLTTVKIQQLITLY